MMEVENLHHSYGRRSVLRGIDIVLPAGMLVGIVGENGVRKSTLFKSSPKGCDRTGTNRTLPTANLDEPTDQKQTSKSPSPTEPRRRHSSDYSPTSGPPRLWHSGGSCPPLPVSASSGTAACTGNSARSTPTKSVPSQKNSMPRGDSRSEFEYSIRRIGTYFWHYSETAAHAIAIWRGHWEPRSIWCDASSIRCCDAGC